MSPRSAAGAAAARIPPRASETGELDVNSRPFVKKNLVHYKSARARRRLIKVSHVRLMFIRRYPKAAPAAWTPAAHTLVAILPNTSHAAAK